MNIWVVGATGMLGKSILSFLHSKNISVVGTGSFDVDITSKDEIDNYVADRDISHIINCAAYTKVDLAENEKERAFNINANGAKNLAVASKDIGAKLIHFSTDYVFSGDKKTPYLEDDMPNPQTVYGMGKLEGEKFVLKYAKDPCIIRVSWLFGFNGNNFVKNILRQMQDKEEIYVVSDQIGKPTCCEDISQNILQILGLKGIFHFANDLEMSWHSFTSLIYEVAESCNLELKVKKINPVNSNYYKALAKRPFNSSLDTSKIENRLKMKMPSLKDALVKYISPNSTEEIHAKN